MFDTYTNRVNPMTAEDLNMRTGWGLALCTGIVKALELADVCLVDVNVIDHVNRQALNYGDDLR